MKQPIPPVPLRRFAQAHAQAAEAINRAAGQGGGYGYLPMGLLGFKAAGNQGGYSTANSTTWTDISNTSFPFTIVRPTFFIYLVYACGHISAGAGNGFFRGSIVGFDNTASPFVNSATAENGTMPYFPTLQGPIQPGTYTIKM